MSSRAQGNLIGHVVALAAVAIMAAATATLSTAEPPPRLDPAAWGADHVGQEPPPFTTGEECLFCHRTDVGIDWANNRHTLTIRVAEADAPAMRALAANQASAPFAEETTLLLGGARRERFLKRGQRQGHLDMLSAEFTPSRTGRRGELLNADDPTWNVDHFADSCAGCHTTAVDPARRAFAGVCVDCYSCHGEPPFDHGEKEGLVYLAGQRRDSAAVVASICGQCHIRTGTSRASGLPYANNFVPGDNLFRDFEVDLSDEAIARLGPADAHVLENVRDMVHLGREETTCLSCHDVHGRSSKKHEKLADAQLCWQCHDANQPKTFHKTYEVHSDRCQY